MLRPTLITVVWLSLSPLAIAQQWEAPTDAATEVAALYNYAGDWVLETQASGNIPAMRVDASYRWLNEMKALSMAQTLAISGVPSARTSVGLMEADEDGVVFEYFIDHAPGQRWFARYELTDVDGSTYTWVGEEFQTAAPQQRERYRLVDTFSADGNRFNRALSSLGEQDAVAWTMTVTQHRRNAFVEQLGAMAGIVGTWSVATERYEFAWGPGRRTIEARIFSDGALLTSETWFVDPADGLVHVRSIDRTGLVLNGVIGPTRTIVTNSDEGAPVEYRVTYKAAGLQASGEPVEVVADIVLVGDALRFEFDRISVDDTSIELDVFNAHERVLKRKVASR